MRTNGTFLFAFWHASYFREILKQIPGYLKICGYRQWFFGRLQVANTLRTLPVQFALRQCSVKQIATD
jgi:hypothetical protein